MKMKKTVMMIMIRMKSQRQHQGADSGACSSITLILMAKWREYVAERSKGQVHLHTLTVWNMLRTLIQNILSLDGHTMGLIALLINNVMNNVIF